jgi:hypothetical protein
VNIFHSLDNKTLSIPLIQNSVVENEDNYIIESDKEQDTYEADLAYLCGILDKVFWNSMYFIDNDIINIHIAN